MSDSRHARPRGFATTQWSLVLAMRPGDDHSVRRARSALAALCQIYWYPLYAFVRRRGHGPDEAQDLTQAFFTRLLETGGLAGADPARGRFRSYLLGAMKHFLANEWHRANAQKRGGAVHFVDLDALEPEARYALAAREDEDPELVFDREWAVTTLERALDGLRDDYEAHGRGALFSALEGCLTGEAPDRDEISQRLDLSEGAVKVAVHRVRKRFRAAIRAEIAKTVDTGPRDAGPRDAGPRDAGPRDDAVEAEMRYLVEVLRATPSLRRGPKD